MENTRKSRDTEMLTDIYKNCKMGLESTAKLMNETHDPQLRRLMGEQLKSYQGFAARAAGLLAEKGKAPADVGFWEKIPSELGMAMNKMMDGSDSKTAQMMINGFAMGVTELKKQCADACCISEQTSALCTDMINFQLRAINDVGQFL